MHTISNIAFSLGRSATYLRRICSDEGIGTLLSPRNRVLTDEDVEQLRQIVNSKTLGGARPGSGPKPKKKK